MPLFTTPDGRYTVAWETPGAVDRGEGDGNSVIYDRGPDLAVPWPGTPVWDRFGHEARLGQSPAPPPHPDLPTPPLPTPTPPDVPRPAPSAPLTTTRVLKVTSDQDGLILPRTYSYWSNGWIGGAGYYVFCGTANGPRFFRVDQRSGEVMHMGPLLPYGGETEGWYWDAGGWIYLIDGPRLLHVNPITTQEEEVFSILETHPGCDLWQAHSSDDGRTHSATVRRITSEGAYPHIGTVVFRKGQQDYFPAQGDLDESHLDATGRWLIMEESDTNRIIDLDTRQTQILPDAEGALSHIDCGPGYMIGEDNIHGQCARWDFDQPLTPGRRKDLFPTWGMGHVSVRGGRGLLSDARALLLLDLTTGERTPLRAHGMVGSGYDYQVKANWDPTGRVACFLTNNGTDRLDLYLLEVP